ncbi:MAG: ATP-binding protein [Ignavibacteriales bacterium]|nr:ATP-binding protein [Ignavibacteriales bacterium]OGU63778.1 MAG: serine/threonine protein kinase [Stygiobacter sp. GWC2_38_9]OGU82729.1 MAG: serine/threonine protein kinase [Stygiobacter sp. RIFOXYA12_FULL_38_9]OGV08252.1 MAG: serine/threonine protein kinase [Stygiobacter sp. RIFOXYB2_FULL_37_11]OGV11895.1 MAG: serine/threonine protein kinase [Stygiobacter sp. RIFOXYA2_FULL_38_8]OGV15855.1 MAG: serine/threonine protein kinase [Stygiobacter sp. RIFOXYC2_FULL_38_25]OGV23977.1 MAG: serine/thr
MFEQQIVVKSSTDNLAEIRDFTKSAAQQCCFDEDSTGKIILAVDEACTNIIKHAYKFTPDGEINISIKFSDGKLSIFITDEGTHFDPTTVPEPDLREYYKQKRVGGLGMFLMKRLMDEVKYGTIAGNKNQVVLIKYLSK